MIDVWFSRLGCCYCLSSGGNYTYIWTPHDLVSKKFIKKYYCIYALQIKNYLRGWMPLKDPKFCLETYTEWNALLSDNSNINFDNTGSTMTLFDRMIWETWLPIVRDVIIS